MAPTHDRPSPFPPPPRLAAHHRSSGSGGFALNVMLEARDPCVVCGYRFTWFWSAGVRVNKHSLRKTAPGLIAGGPPICPECGSRARQDGAPARWQLDPESQQKVDAARAKRGWA